MLNVKKIVFISLVFVLVPVYAEQTPTPMSSDKRIRTVNYHQDNVVKLYSHYLYTTILQFAPYEKVIGVFPGDAKAWSVVTAYNRILIKPVVMGKNIQTNLYVVTSANREYHFTLIANYSSDPNDSKMVYKLRFVYPQDEAAKKTSKALQQQATNSGKRHVMNAKDPSLWNMSYSYKGDRSITPTRVFDDGKFTYFEFPKNQEIPAIFLVHPDSKESILNHRMDGSYLVVERIGGQFTLRAGKNQVACIFNDPFLASYKKRTKQKSRKAFNSLNKKSEPKKRKSSIKKRDDTPSKSEPVKQSAQNSADATN